MKNATKDFLQIVAENPGLPIFGFVDSDVVADDGGRWLASFGRAYVGEIATYGERFYEDRESFKEEYYDDHEDELCERFSYDPYTWGSGVSQGIFTPEQVATITANNEAEQAMEKYLDEIADRYFVKAILVNVNTPDDLIRE